MKRWLRLAWQVVSFAIFGAVLVWGGPEALQQIRTGDWRIALVACLLLGIATVLATTRFQLVTRAIVGRHVAAWRRFYHLNITTRALGLVVPRSVSMLGGKSIGLRGMGVSLKRSAWIVVVDNLFDLAFLGMLAAPAVLFLTGKCSAWAFSGLSLALLAALAGGLWWFSATRRLDKLIHWLRRFGRLAAILPPESEDSSKLLPSPAENLAALGLSVLLNGVLVTCYYLVARAVGIDESWWIFVAGFPITQLSLVISLTPGGLGIFDAGWYGVLHLSGVPQQAALTFVIAQRAYVFVFVLVWTGVSLLVSLKDKT